MDSGQITHMRANAVRHELNGELDETGQRTRPDVSHSLTVGGLLQKGEAGIKTRSDGQLR